MAFDAPAVRQVVDEHQAPAARVGAVGPVPVVPEAAPAVAYLDSQVARVDTRFQELTWTVAGWQWPGLIGWGLALVAGRARQQAGWLDAHPPDLRGVAPFCAARGNRELFNACAEAAMGLLAGR